MFRAILPFLSDNIDIGLAQGGIFSNLTKEESPDKPSVIIETRENGKITTEKHVGVLLAGTTYKLDNKGGYMMRSISRASQFLSSWKQMLSSKNQLKRRNTIVFFGTCFNRDTRSNCDRNLSIRDIQIQFTSPILKPVESKCQGLARHTKFKLDHTDKIWSADSLTFAGPNIPPLPKRKGPGEHSVPEAI